MYSEYTKESYKLCFFVALVLWRHFGWYIILGRDTVRRPHNIEHAFPTHETFSSTTPPMPKQHHRQSSGKLDGGARSSIDLVSKGCCIVSSSSWALNQLTARSPMPQLSIAAAATERTSPSILDKQESFAFLEF